MKIRNGGPGVSPATTLRVDWIGQNIRAVDNSCSAGTCCNRGACTPRSGACPTPTSTPNFNSASIPSLLPGAEISITVDAVADVPGFPGNQVEWGRVTLDPDNRVNDPNRQNNQWTMRP
ncbi:MAG: hypothetical protein IT480_01065 [Gammaproteobacteria bacterium]|nr:hypothetical protein [Gammaproteobacteria bacterium]